ncbi:hypothetical protein SteCoe_13767 [Stentor coeruleus]|uniref:Uncharacterized protein n=1 Tax=Stentor coeruleus TaxID=5963 RepID=A0A1R2C7L0_9CILI|nr:hypothetical protein SteCoe_13767 [Stentor coeruleus]
MSSLWNSINSSKKTPDSISKCQRRTSKPKFPIPATSPKSLSNTKTAPSYLISTSILSSMSSLHRGPLEKNYLNMSTSKGPIKLPSYPSITAKCSYKIDAANLLAICIRKFIYKHFSIWRLGVFRSRAVEKRCHGNKSLVIQVTVSRQSREKIRFQSISINRKGLEEKSSEYEVKRPDRHSMDSPGPMKITDLDQTIETSDKNFLSYGSRGYSPLRNSSELRCLSSQSIKRSESYGLNSINSYKKSPVNDKNSLWSFKLACCKDLDKILKLLIIKTQKSAFRTLLNTFNTYKKATKLYKTLILLAKNKKKPALISLSKFSKAKIFLESLQQKLVKIFRSQKLIGFLSLKSIQKSKISKSKEVSFEESFKSLKNTLAEISNSKKRVEKFHRNLTKYQNKAVEMEKILEKIIWRKTCRWGNLILVQIFENPDPKFIKNAVFSISEALCRLVYRTFWVKVVGYARVRVRIRKTLGYMLKIISKDVEFRVNKSFCVWKECYRFSHADSFEDLKVATIVHVLGNLFFIVKCRVFKILKLCSQLKNRDPIRKKPVNMKKSLLQLLKRSNKHLVFVKSRAFHMMKYTNTVILPRSEPRQKVISQVVRVLSRKISNVFRYFHYRVDYTYELKHRVVIKLCKNTQRNLKFCLYLWKSSLD